MSARIPLLVLSLVVTAGVTVAACGSSSDSEFNNPDGGNGSSSGSSGSSSGLLGGGGDASAEGAVPCTGLCLQQQTCAGGGTTSLSGKVYDPAGQVPLYNVIVYVPNAPVAPITNGASCDRCGDVSGSPLVSAITDTTGSFQLTNVPVGANIPVVVQVGKWRRQFTVANVPACTDTPLDPAMTRLPKNHTEGDIPLMALTTGGADAMECFLRKVGIEDSEFSVGGGAGRVQFYGGSGGATNKFDSANGGASFTDAQTFWSNEANLDKYDIVLLSCEGQTYANTKPQAALDALYNYTAKGGRVFASHWHRFWFDPLNDNNGGVKGTTMFGDLGVWDDDNIPDTIQASVDTTFPKGKAMHDWLSNVAALSAGDTLEIDGAKKNLTSVNATNAQQWITYPTPQAVEYMSFNIPVGVPDDQKCGRAVYSDLHVSSGVGDQPGQAWPDGCKTTSLSPQEKALEFMLFDLSSCIQSDTAPPAPPPVVN